MYDSVVISRSFVVVNSGQYSSFHRLVPQQYPWKASRLIHSLYAGTDV